ncbi:hypothetical protein BCV70DRAFT_167897 [Testicularia cyperi]|uniref:ditrans,polycis-polyprenyl diphosphate synthase [(2E,6E)-farnesyldiphosphate specific] n=1 Tax=Testicularia cyperi TaxID=1882483 RepID=A0A317XFM5_9BASI|nr:hypothetical protein BCV70DRAFT_167897 [Testicularia cyperi]
MPRSTPSKSSPSSSTSASASSSLPPTEDFITLLLKPVLLLGFAVLHLAYHLLVTVQDAVQSLKQLGRGKREVEDLTHATWSSILHHHDSDEQRVRIPQHLAVVLADTPPSSLRLWIGTLFRRISTRERPHQHVDIWSELRILRKRAVLVKNAKDTAKLIHLSRLSGVEQLTIYSKTQPPTQETLCLLRQALLESFKTLALVHRPQHSDHATRDGSNGSSSSSNWADKSIGSEPTSSNSSDTEGSSSLNETLASSYTAEELGSLQPSPSSPSTAAPEDAPKPLKVTLVSAQDGAERFLQLVGSYADKVEQDYIELLSTDIDTALASAVRTETKLSASTLRRAWVAKRQPFVAKLTAAELDRHLLDAGYVAEPELLIVFGGRRRSRQLHGFPAWAIRLSDLFHDPAMRPNLPYSSRDFVAALSKFRGAEHRYGR